MRKNFRNIKQIVLRGKRYRINLASTLGPESDPVYGRCSSPNDPGRIIQYDVSLTGQRRLDVFIHEMLHACFWDISEEGIQFASIDIAKSLWRFGYRMELDQLNRGIEDPQYLTVRGKQYKFDRITGLTKGKNIYVSAPYSKGKFIQIRISLRGEKELEVLLMSLLSVSYWDFDDEAIEETSRSIARALWRIGYRRK